MRHLFALVLWLLVGTAQAQAVPECMPAVYGAQFPGSKIHGPIRGDAGWYGWGWCSAPDGHPYAIYRLCAHGECAANIGQAVGSVLMQLGAASIGADPKAIYGGWWTTNPPAFICDGTPPAGTPRGNACTELVALLAADKPQWTAPPPPPPASAPAPTYTHRVKPLTGATDRPVYPFANGVRGTTAIPKARATVGEGCRPEVATAPSGVSTTDLYAAYAPAFAASQVTLCTKQ